MMGIMSKNRKEWNIMNMANFHQGFTTVALYDTLGADAMRFVCNQTELTTIACSNECILKLAKMKTDDAQADEQKMHRLVNLVCWDSNVTEEDKAGAEAAGLKLYTMEEVIVRGQAEFKAGNTSVKVPEPDDIYMFSYTSGTTGDPKGVMLSHKMILGAAYAAQTRLATGLDNVLNKDDTYISYLPAAHSFEQVLVGLSLLYGVRTGFFAGNVLKLTDDIALLKPTLFPSVPRLYNKIYGKIQDKFKAATGLKAWLVNKAVAAKMHYLRAGEGLTHKIYDALVFGKVAAILGGNVRLMVTGSAPIAGDVLEFLKVAFSCPIVEGYGMTESSGASVATIAGDPEIGHVGGCLQNVKIRLRDIPEMNYLSTNDPPAGEVCFWGPSVMSGYFRNAEKTKEAIPNGDGWLHSGDVAKIFPNGAIKIVDRAKNIFKLSQGEYIAPEKLENVYIKSEWLAQVWIHGDSLHDYALMFAVVDPDRMKKYR